MKNLQFFSGQNVEEKFTLDDNSVDSDAEDQEQD